MMETLERKVLSCTEFNDIVERMKNIVEEYDRIGLDENKFSLTFANGDHINLKIGENYIAHLLGLNVDLLRNERMVKANMSSYEILKKFLDDLTYYTIKNNSTINSEKVLSNIFSKHVEKKLDAFSINSRLKPEKVRYIIKYDSKRTYQTEEIAEKVDYYIISKEDNIYYALGVVGNDDEEFVKYMPMTSRKYETEEEFNEFLKKILPHQEITYLSKSHVENYYKGFNGTFSLPPDLKKGILFNMIELGNKYSATVAVGKELMYALTSASNNYQQNDNNVAILNLLADSIESNSILSSEDITAVLGDVKIMPDIQRIINVCNDILCKSSSSNGNNAKAYSDIQNENIKLKEDLKEIRDSLTTLQEQFNALQEEKNQLEIDNNHTKSSLNILMEAFQRVQLETDSNKELEKK